MQPKELSIDKVEGCVKHADVDCGLPSTCSFNTGFALFHPNLLKNGKHIIKVKDSNENIRLKTKRLSRGFVLISMETVLPTTVVLIRYVES